MTYEKINQITLYFRWMQESKMDILNLTSVFKGLGKSTTNIQLATKYMENFGLKCKDCGVEWVFTGTALIGSGDRYESLQVRQGLHEPCPNCKSENISMVTKLNFGKYLAYDNDEVYDRIFDLPKYSPILCDEAVNFMMGEDWAKYDSKKMKKIFAKMRTKGLLVLACMPKFKWTDRKYREDMCTSWIRVMKRGIALFRLPNLGEVDDAWNMKDFSQLLGNIFFFTPEDEIIHRAEKIVSKDPCTLDWFKIPPLPKDIEEEYLRVRDEKVFKRQGEEFDIDQKELAKIVLFNIYKSWDRFMLAIKESKCERPTTKILSEHLLTHPITKEPIYGKDCMVKWMKEMEDKLRQKVIDDKLKEGKEQ